MVALIASIVGAFSGIGGGVIIKPLLDLTSNYDISTISLLSSFTVFSMAIASIIKQFYSKARFEKKITIPLAFGAVIGGFFGDSLLSYLIEFSGNPIIIKQVQNLLLMMLLIFVLIYINKLKGHAQYKVKNMLLIIFIGMSLGIISTFIGIGGGPINIVVLILFFSLDTKSATVNSLVLIIFSQFSKLLNVSITQGLASFDLSMLIYMIPAGIIGGIVGSTLNRKLNQKHITRVFNCVLIFIISITAFNIIK